MNPRDGLKSYTKKELAILYELSPRAFYTLLKPHEAAIGIKVGRYYSIKQVEMIFARLGIPNSFLPDDFEIK